MPITLHTLNHIAAIDAQQWNQLAGQGYPFIRHEFLSALEQSGAVCPNTGWTPCHQLIYLDKQLIGILPLYLKTHSWGEYVFDWSWAEAYRNHGVAYYPKLISAIPYTPATGPRLIVDTAISSPQLIHDIYTQVLQQLHHTKASSLHVLFTEPSLNTTLASTALLCRAGVQFHWFNRHAQDNTLSPYADFSDYLSDFNSRKRRSVSKERQRLAEQHITFKRYRGKTITPDLWDIFFQCYQQTYLKRSGHSGYLNRQFFAQLAETMSETILLITAERNHSIIATALYFVGHDTLYGRYWGSLADVNGLHFEACYYQGIEFCIEHQLQRFDPGAQGEHKISRGFRPTFTYSWHYLAHPDFHQAVDRFLAEEKLQLIRYYQETEALLPFRNRAH